MHSKFQDFTVEQLVMHGQFRQWVQHPTKKLDAFWTAWIGEKPERAELATEARQLIVSLQFPDDLKDGEIDQEWAKMQALMQPEDNTAKTIRMMPAERRIAPFYWRIAAVLILLLVSVGALYNLLKQSPEVEYSTAYGEVKTIALPDGSTVVLNANSKLRYLKEWDLDDLREVWLDGEAYFSVIHQAYHQKFIVRTSDPFSVEVVGTTFTVLNRTDRNRVVLNSGKVRLQAELFGNEKSILMKPGELVEVKNQAIDFTQKMVNSEMYSAFTSNFVQFNNTPLEEILLQIRDLYGLHVQIPNGQLAGKEFTGTFPINKPDLLLQALSRTYQLNLRKVGDQLILESLPDASR